MKNVIVYFCQRCAVELPSVWKSQNVAVFIWVSCMFAVLQVKANTPEIHCPGYKQLRETNNGLKKREASHKRGK